MRDRTEEYRRKQADAQFRDEAIGYWSRIFRDPGLSEKRRAKARAELAVLFKKTAEFRERDGEEAQMPDMRHGERERLPKRRRTVTYEMGLSNCKMFLSLGLYPDGRVGEIFISTAKDGSMLRTALSAWAIMVSKGLQFGIPLPEIIHTFKGTRCDEGYVSCIDVPAIHEQPVSSAWDAVVRLLEAETDDKGRHCDYVSGKMSYAAQTEAALQAKAEAALDGPRLAPPAPPLPRVCESCQKPAVVHVTEIRSTDGGQETKTVRHLCGACAPDEAKKPS